MLLFGLTKSEISSKPAFILDNIVENNGTELHWNEFTDGTGLEWYEYGPRMCDVQIGMWSLECGV